MVEIWENLKDLDGLAKVVVDGLGLEDDHWPEILGFFIVRLLVTLGWTEEEIPDALKEVKKGIDVAWHG